MPGHWYGEVTARRQRGRGQTEREERREEERRTERKTGGKLSLAPFSACQKGARDGRRQRLEKTRRKEDLRAVGDFFLEGKVFCLLTPQLCPADWLHATNRLDRLRTKISFVATVLHIRVVYWEQGRVSTEFFNVCVEHKAWQFGYLSPVFCLRANCVVHARNIVFLDNRWSDT